MDLNILPLVGFTFVSFIAIGFTGFGGMIIPVTLGAHLYPIKWILAVMIPASPFGNLLIVIRHRQHIQFKILIRKIFPAMFIGVLIGLSIFHYVPEQGLKRAFGGLVVVVSLAQLNKMRKKSYAELPFPPVLNYALFLLAGTIQGIFATGGPVVVYIVSRMGLNKAQFRATVSTVWMTMNIFISIAYAVTGRISTGSLRSSAIMIIPILAGILVGEQLHNRVDEEKFRISIYLFLLITGISILAR